MAEEKTKLALAISGAISLGSYEAGVIYELFTILQKLGKDSKFEIDVIAGASAGSVNGAILSLAMMYDCSLIELLKKVWLENLDIAVLLEELSDPWKSIFSDRIINDLKKDILEAVRKSVDNSLPSAPEKLKMVFTLSNLSGIPYSVKFNNKKEDYSLTTFADKYSIELSRAKKDEMTLKEIGNMLDLAIVSGAFPFAFPAKSIKRSRDDYKDTQIDKGGSPELDFVYVDGGIFNNEPVNRARELADTLDAKETKRVYLLVDPTPPEPLLAFKKLDMLSVGMRLIPAILTEAHFRDWCYAIKVNERLKLQQKFISGMKAALSAFKKEELEGLNMKFAEVAGSIAEYRAGAEKELYLSNNKARINKLLMEDAKIINDFSDSNTKDALTNFMLILEDVSGLKSKKILDIRLLSPEEKGALAGDFLMNFGGFFSPKYREHDFNIGRNVARDFVSRPKTEGGLGIDLSSYSLEACPYEPNLNNVDVKDAPIENRKKLRDSIVKRIDKIITELLKKYGVGILARLVGPLVLPFVSWRWLVRKIIRSKLTTFLNSKLGIK